MLGLRARRQARQEKVRQQLFAFLVALGVPENEARKRRDWLLEIIKNSVMLPRSLRLIRRNKQAVGDVGRNLLAGDPDGERLRFGVGNIAIQIVFGRFGPSLIEGFVVWLQDYGRTFDLERFKTLAGERWIGKDSRHWQKSEDWD